MSKHDAMLASGKTAELMFKPIEVRIFPCGRERRCIRRAHTFLNAGCFVLARKMLCNDVYDIVEGETSNRVVMQRQSSPKALISN